MFGPSPTPLGGGLILYLLSILLMPMDGELVFSQEEGGGDYPRQHATTYHTSTGVPGKKMGLEKSH